jgi:hypothetical protein
MKIHKRPIVRTGLWRNLRLDFKPPLFQMRILIIILIILLANIADAQNSGLVVISNPKGSPPNLKWSELKSILLGERQRWRNGNKVVIALMKTNTEVGKSTSERIYNMTPDEVKKYWLALVFQGKAEAPVFFSSATELQAFVAENPGSIGVIDQPLPHYNTLVVTIDGKKIL